MFRQVPLPPNNPVKTYGPPLSFGGPSLSNYAPPPQNYGAPPSQNYGSPPQSNYGAPHQSYGIPSGPPLTSYGVPEQRISGSASQNRPNYVRAPEDNSLVCKPTMILVSYANES